jgi:hypothetical protein
MNSAHASLLQWLQDNPGYSVITWGPDVKQPYWLVRRPSPHYIDGIGDSYEAACYDLLQQLKK